MSESGSVLTRLKRTVVAVVSKGGGEGKYNQKKNKENNGLGIEIF